jgi:radical SAM protein with 4Fe4S-binding SPASM domain
VADVAKYRRIKAKLEQAFATGKLNYYENMPLARFVHAKERLSTKTVLKTIDTGQFQVPCYAGALSAVISEEGDVYACEMLSNKIGNLREAGYDLTKLWEGERAQSMRSFIRDTKCFCTHECNMSINLLFNPAVYPKIVKEMVGELVSPGNPEGIGPEPKGAGETGGAKTAPMTRRIPILPGDPN